MGSRRTYDTEMITLRQIFAYNSNNSVIPALRVLTTDGKGGTLWATPSSVGGIPAFNEVIANGTSILADEPFNRLYLSTSDGLGMIRNPATNEIRFYNKGFTEFNVVGGNKLVGYSNNTVTPVVKFEGRGGVRVSADPLTNTMFIQGVPTAISTAAYAFGQINVISNASTLTPNAIGNSNNAYLTATSPSSLVSILGLGDIKLYTNTTSNAYFIGISTFNSADYLQLSSIAFNGYASTLSTVSSLFYDIPKTGVATSSLKNLISNISTGIDSNFKYFETYFVTNYTSLNYFGLNSTSVGNTLSNIQADINYLYIQQGVIDVVNIQQTSTATGTNTTTLSSFNDSFSTNLIKATTIGVNCNSPQYTVDINGSLNATNIIGYPTQIQLNSTVTGLGTSGYISSPQLLSTVGGLGTYGYISTLSLESTVIGLGTTGYISTQSLVSTVIGLGSSDYLSSIQLVSTVQGLGSIGYVSTLTLEKTVYNLGQVGYVSTLTLESTLSGLANIGYISTTQIDSTIQGLGTYAYVSTASLESTIIGLGTSRYISTASLESTVIGLGTSRYISTASLESTVIGLGSSRYISTASLESTLEGLGTFRYISTASLESTLTGLGTFGYISTASLTSTVTGLGPIINFFSTIPQLPTNLNLGALAGCNVIVSSVEFTIDSMSSMIQEGATGYIRVSPNFSFDFGDSNFPQYAKVVNTYIVVNSNIISNTRFYRSWAHTPATVGIYTDTIQIEIDNSNMMSNITSTFTICHDFSSLYSASNNNFYQTPNGCSIHFCSPR
jgi:hypothetical protein